MKCGFEESAGGNGGGAAGVSVADDRCLEEETGGGELVDHEFCHIGGGDGVFNAGAVERRGYVTTRRSVFTVVQRTMVQSRPLCSIIGSMRFLSSITA